MDWQTMRTTIGELGRSHFEVLPETLGNRRKKVTGKDFILYDFPCCESEVEDTQKHNRFIVNYFTYIFKSLSRLTPETYEKTIGRPKKELIKELKKSIKESVK